MSRTPLAFVACANAPRVLAGCLLASPCLATGRYPLAVHFASPSAAWAFNKEMDYPPAADWLVWVHQDVYLPENWDAEFLSGIEAAERQMSGLAVVGVYGVGGGNQNFDRAGHVIDRGTVLRGSAPLPAPVSSLDELLLAVRVGSGLHLDASLGFDFYGTDVVLTAQAAGLQAAVIDAPCEHRSSLPVQGSASPELLRRIIDSAAVFERKWAHRLPLETPCFRIHEPGDVAKFVRTHFQEVS